MSSADLRRLTDELSGLADTIAAGAGPIDLDQAGLSTLLAAASRIYTACSTDPYGRDALAALAVTPTEACTVAATLLRSQSLTPFEFSIWFSGGRVGGGT